MPGVLLEAMSSPPPGTGDTVATATNKRRSGRVSKKPDFLAAEPNAAGAKRKRTAPHDDEDDDDDRVNGAMSETDDNNDAGEDEDEDEADEEERRDRRAKKPKAAAAPKRPAAKKPKTNGATVQMPIRGTAQQKARKLKRKVAPGAVPNAEEAGGLYSEVFSGEKSIEEVVGEWLQRFREHESNALAEVINFVLRCCGCESEITNYDIEDVDGATNKLSDLQDELIAQNVSDYPIVARTKFATTLKKTLEDFFAVMIKTIDAADVLFTNVELIENIQVWLSTMTGAQNRPFRHTATVASLSVMTALCEIGRDTAAAAATSRRQSENMAKGKGGNKRRASGLLQDAQKAQQKQSLIDTLVKDWFDTIFIHRYRDVEPKIRVECVHALGDWIVIYPDVFFDGSHLRYLGWELSDAHWPARHEVVKQLIRLYDKKERVAGLKTFTERFRSRMVEMATLDSEAAVRASAVELLDLLRQAGYLEPDDIDAVGRLVFDSEPRVRKAVVDFFSASVDEIYESKVEDLGGEEAITEELGDSAESTERPGLPWLRLKCLVEVLESYDAVDPEVSKNAVKGPGNNYRLHAGELESRFIVVAESLYSNVEAIKDWDTLANYLLYDTSDGGQNGVAEGVGTQLRDACKLNEREEFILLELLNVAVRQHVANLVDSAADKRTKKTKKQKDELADEQESTARQITNLIPKLLKRFGDSPQTALAVLRLERIVSLDAFTDFQQDPSTYKNLLDDIEKQFLSHVSEDVLTEASRALLRAKNYQDVGEVTDEKIEEMWEETLDVFRRLAGTKDLNERGNLSEQIADGMSKTVSRLEHLAQISDPTTHLALEPQAKKGTKRQSKATSASSALELLTSLIHRAVREQDTTEDPAYASKEDDIALHAARVVGFHLLWSISSLRTQLETTTPPDSLLDTLAAQRDAYISTLVTALASRQPSEQVAIDLASLILDAHTSAATLRHTKPVDPSIRDHLALAMDVPAPVQAQVLRVFGAAEQRFATKTGRAIEKVRDDTGAKRKTKKPKAKKAATQQQEPDIDADPMDEDDLDRDPAGSSDGEGDAGDADAEPADEADSDVPPSLISDDGASDDDEDADDNGAKQVRAARREALRLHNALWAEKSLCELGSKLVLAVLAGVVDEARTRRRLEVNRAKLGANWREVVKFLDLGRDKEGKGKAAGAKGKAAAATAAKKKASEAKRIAEEIVVSSESEGEDEVEEDEDEDGEEAGAEVDEEPDKEVESVLGD